MTRPDPAEVTARVAAVRELMRAEGLDGLIVRSTDRFLNEYVPLAESTRAWVTGFTGSTGDAYLTLDRGWLCLDGRYHLQGGQQVEGTPWEVDPVDLGTPIARALALRVEASAAEGARRVGYEPDRTSVRELELLRGALGDEVELVPLEPSLIERARGAAPETRAPIRAVSAAAAGESVEGKLACVRERLEADGLAAFLVQRLDELAYVTNLRGDDFPYQATFRGLGLVLADRVVLAADRERLPAQVEAGVEVVAPGAWAAALAPGARVGIDAGGTTAAARDALVAAGAEPVAAASPLAALKARKNEAELAAMREAFRRADLVVEQVQDLVAGRLAAGERITEADLAAETERLFREAGATGLSFQVIAAAGANGAHIHYSDPDPERALAPEDMVLLDTGAYFAAGYATDLTRTFLAGGPEQVAAGTPAQRRMFTLVLKSAVAAMSARVPAGAHGVQLDAIARAPLWAAGVDFAHGTGHGVGINVHEAPPRVSTRSYQPFEVGHVFSIEPGLYVPGEGGVRIENLCTVVPAEGAPGFLDVTPLTFSRLDERLIDDALLTDAERAWLAGYAARRREVLGEAARPSP